MTEKRIKISLLYGLLSCTTRSAIADCTARRVRNVKRTSFLLGVGAFKPKFYGNGVIPCQNADTLR